MLTDGQISNNYKPLNIKEVLNKLNIDEDNVYQYGNFIAKVDNFVRGNNKGKLVLVTSTSPDKVGIGKTTVTIGLNDALNKNDVSSVACIREPSLGPIFGLKGGASGGGYSQAYPMEEINLEFTGDFYAITSINNLISAAIDNSIFHDNYLNIDSSTISFNRVIDMNDRSLRNIETSANLDKYRRDESFKLTPASEIMAVLALCENFEDFINNVEDITVAKDYDGNFIKVRDLNIRGSILVLAKKLINPNLVQSLKGNPIFIHGGPFANIAHGTNSIIADKMALSMVDYVVTEAGFGSDMGAEKFLNIVLPKADLDVHAIVLVTTIGSLKEYSKKGKLEEGISNLVKHINHLKKYGTNLVVTLNKYSNDTVENITLLKDECMKNSVEFFVNEFYVNENEDKVSDLANKILDFADLPKYETIYNLTDSLEDKVSKVVKNVYNAYDYVLVDECKEKFNNICKNEEYSNYPICFAKNPNSFSGNPDDKFKDDGYEIIITDVEVMTGAKFIVLYVNKILTLPGLSKNANLYKIKYDLKTNEIIGLD